MWRAAGMIHSDIQRGFVRAEVVSWDELVGAGGYAGARDRGNARASRAVSTTSSPTAT